MTLSTRAVAQEGSTRSHYAGHSEGRTMQVALCRSHYASISSPRNTSRACPRSAAVHSSPDRWTVTSSGSPDRVHSLTGDVVATPHARSIVHGLTHGFDQLVTTDPVPQASVSLSTPRS